MENFRLSVAVIAFRDGDADAVASNLEFRSTFTLERHREPYPGPLTLERLHAWYDVWLLLAPLGAEGDELVRRWEAIPGSRARRLIPPEPHDSLAALVSAGADPVQWVRGELAWLGIAPPTPLVASL